MTDNLSTTKLLQDTRAAMDKVQRTHAQWRGTIIGDEVSGARATLRAVQDLMVQVAALEEALTAYIEEHTAA